MHTGFSLPPISKSQGRKLVRVNNCVIQRFNLLTVAISADFDIIQNMFQYLFYYAIATEVHVTLCDDLAKNDCVGNYQL